MKVKNIFMVAAASVIALCSCGKLLDIPQHGVLNYETYYQTDEDAENAIVACYLQMRGLNYNYTLGKNMLTDDFWAGGGGRNDNAELEQLNEFTFGTDQSMLQGMFESYYQIIYKANVVLGHVTGDSPVMERARAEAKVFRAWAYFELISMWGNPPLVDHELEPSEYQKPNGTTEELWGLVEKDLTEAIASGCLIEKTSVNDKTWRVTKQFAQAVLGKSYLWQEKYSDAAEQFDLVVNSKLYELYGDYENMLGVEAKQNCESLFESIKYDDVNNAWDNFDMTGVMIHYRTDKMTLGAADQLADTGWGFLNPTKSLYDDFVKVEGENGYRLNCTMKTYEQMKERGHSVNVGQSIISEGYFMWKWRGTKSRFSQYVSGLAFFMDTNNPRWMRYAEVLLCGAEAHLKAGNAGKATEYFNQVRT
ncbi:MAG: RagB/SusD family nutrient uptake outer membrane protein, partial [Candidatus Cryptobacteroides sp.]